jgi:hypothetical protein
MTNQQARDALLFLRRGAAFTVGGLVLLALIDPILGLILRRDGHMRRVAAPVYLSIKAAAEPSEETRSIFLGDSVARQFFALGNEPGPEYLFLASMEPVSMAGQFYTLERALLGHPNTKEVVLMLRPESLLNDLSTEMAYNYFCLYFSDMRHVWEVYGVSRNPTLMVHHFSRSLFPNVFSVIAFMNVGQGQLRTLPVAPPQLQDSPPLQIGLQSPVTRFFLSKIRALAASHGATFRLLPCPNRKSDRVDVEPAIFDVPPVFVDDDWFTADRVHLKGPNVEEARRISMQAWGLLMREQAPREAQQERR